MGDSSDKKGKQDRIRVNPNQKHEVQYTGEKTDSSAEDVREAAKKVGPMRKEVEKELGKKKK